LFADDRPCFETLIAAWPTDVRQHLLILSAAAFAPVAEAVSV
jgi:hypothetical protein